MEQNRIKIFNLRNGLLLAVISYALYTVLWLFVDGDILTYNPTLSEIALDFVVCASFSFLSLAVSHLIFKILRFHTGFRWSIIYGAVLFILNNVIAILVVRSFDFIFNETNDRLFQVQGIYTFAMLSTLISSIYIITAFMNYYNSAIEEKHEAEIMLMKEKETALEAQLNALKMQINPHFLFNNFSTLSELIESEPETASVFLSHLSKVYRHIVRNLNVNLIDIKDELNFIDSYVYLMRLRHGEGIRINIDKNMRQRNGKIPPASLQLLVENAIKHNAFSVDKPLVINIAREGEYIVVGNLKQPLVSHAESTGIGQANIIRRYDLLSDKGVRIVDTDNVYSVSLPIL